MLGEYKIYTNRFLLPRVIKTVPFSSKKYFLPKVHLKSTLLKLEFANFFNKL